MDDEKMRTERDLNRFVCHEIRTAVERGLTPIVGGDLNSVDDPTMDTGGTRAVHREESLVSTLLAAGMIDTFRSGNPTMQATSRQVEGDKGNRLDTILIWPSVETKCVAAALHIDHRLNTDHRVALADMDRSCVEDQEEEDEEPNDQVKWRAFRELCQTAARQPEEWEKLQNQVIEMLGEGSEGRMEQLARELHEISKTGVRLEGVRETLGEKGKLLEDEVMRVVREMVGTNAEGGVRRKKKELTEKLTRAKTEVSRLQALVKDALS
jgi:hypothetical protein